MVAQCFWRWTIWDLVGGKTHGTGPDATAMTLARQLWIRDRTTYRYKTWVLFISPQITYEIFENILTPCATSFEYFNHNKDMACVFSDDPSSFPPWPSHCKVSLSNPKLEEPSKGKYWIWSGVRRCHCECQGSLDRWYSVTFGHKYWDIAGKIEKYFWSKIFVYIAAIFNLVFAWIINYKSVPVCTYINSCATQLWSKNVCTTWIKMSQQAIKPL